MFLVTVSGSAKASAFVFPPELWGLSPWTEGLGSLGEGACPACVCAACEVPVLRVKEKPRLPVLSVWSFPALNPLQIYISIKPFERLNGL